MAVVFLLWIACAGLCAWIADRKGRSVGAFTLIGLVFGVFGVIYAACARDAAELPAEPSRTPW